jgi:uncharacterized protein YigE (DUF2233 family)
VGTGMTRRNTGVLAAAIVGVAFCVNLISRKARATAPVADALISEQTFEDSRFIVCSYSSKTQHLRLACEGADGKPLVSFKALEQFLGPDAARVRFAMNGGMYTPEGGSLGLYVEKGKTLNRILKGEGGGNFFLKPNGVFSVDADGTVHVDTTEAYLARKSKPVWATQSGPMLVIDGALHPKFQPDGESRQIRNGVGRLNEHTALFVISDTPVSFGKFARFFRDRLHCQDALFFDGSISSLWAPALHRQAHAAPMGPMVVVLDK